jgi:hypothetical protein
MNNRIHAGALVRWCVHLSRPSEAIVLQGRVKTYPYSPGCALVTIRDADGREWVERDAVLLIGDLVVVGRCETAEVIPLGVAVGGGCRLVPEAMS